MLTIHPVINQKFSSVHFGNKNISEVDKLKAEYDNDEDRILWEKQQRDLEEIIADKEKSIPKPMKTAMKGGAVLAAGVLGGMATGWSAKYIIAAFKDMASSKLVKNAAEKFDNIVKTPISKAFRNIKKFVSKKVTAFKNTKTFQNSKQGFVNKLNKFENSKFAKSLKKIVEKISGNKLVQKTGRAIDAVLGFLAEGVVKAYNKLAGINYKKAVVNTLGVAGGISTGAVEAMDTLKKPEDSEGEE